nr:hypothetical protein [Tanacetum cinerariifolium]
GVGIPVFGLFEVPALISGLPDQADVAGEVHLVKSTGKNADGKDTADVTGDLTLHGVTKPVVIKAVFNGEGKDPWGGYRAGFNGTTTIKRSDFGKMMDLGPQSDTVTFDISFEGVKAK